MKDKLNSDVLKNNEKYKSIFENCLDAVLLTGPDGKIYSANKAAQTKKFLLKTKNHGKIIWLCHSNRDDARSFNLHFFVPGQSHRN